ncbi:MAG: outer membrane protein OmpA-like peptidoglycan-associated protein, partial [Myxococcota bacterium]
CPLEPEDIDTYQDDDGCPDIDNDSDGFLDVDDACPLVAGLIRSCPDSDGDGFADIDDECPLQPGPVYGCLDTDGDQVPDHRDLCPLQAAPPGADPLRSNGCPSVAFFDRNQIVIQQKVYFDLDSARIREASYPLLREVAARLRENPDIDLIEIAGHTDNTGGTDYNLRLSQRRAAAVRRYLVEEGGVSPARIRSEGYGESTPLTSNETDAGRAINRRVEFLIIIIERRPTP